MGQIVYFYNRFTGVFDGSDWAQPDPENEGEYLIPAFSTTEMPPPLETNQAAVWNENDAVWEIQTRPEIITSPGPEYQLREDGWHKTIFTKKDFLLRCGLAKVAALNGAINSGNVMAKTVHDLLFASEYIDVTDPATVQLVNLMATEGLNSIFTAEEAAAILAGEKYETDLPETLPE